MVESFCLERSGGSHDLRFAPFGRYPSDRSADRDDRWGEHTFPYNGDPTYMENPLRQDLWRAGHALAGVWLILALVALRYVDEANLSNVMKWLVRGSIPMAAILVPALLLIRAVARWHSPEWAHLSRLCRLWWPPACSFSASASSGVRHRGLQVYYQLVFIRHLNRQIGRLLTPALPDQSQVLSRALSLNQISGGRHPEVACRDG
jgi:hypothetical protein